MMRVKTNASPLRRLGIAGLSSTLLALNPGTGLAADTVHSMPGMDHSQMEMKPAPPAADQRNENAGMETMDHIGMTMEPATSASDPDKAKTEMGAMDHTGMHMQGGPAPIDARDPHANSGGYALDAGPYALPGPRQLKMADEHNFMGLMIDRLERVHSPNANTARYDIQAWWGRDYNRLVLKAEGDIAQGKLDDAGTELLWGHAIATFWDVHLGLRHDSGEAADRTWLAFGVQGLAPYWFEIDATAYIGENGRTALALEAEYDLLLSQKLVLQPRVEASLYGKRDAARATGSGLSELSAGLRLRYALRREIAPYIGVERLSRFGGTRDYVRESGENGGETQWLAGVRFWY